MKFKRPSPKLRSIMRPRSQLLQAVPLPPKTHIFTTFPTELLLFIVEYLSHIDRFSLRLTCSRFYHLLSAPSLCKLIPQLSRFGVRWERDAIVDVLSRDRYYHYEQRLIEAPESFIGQALCWRCKDVHALRSFFDVQLAESPSVRGCKRDAVIKLPQAAGVNLSYADARHRLKWWFGQYWDEAGVYVPWNAQACTAQVAMAMNRADRRSRGGSGVSLERIENEENAPLLSVQLRRYNVFRRTRFGFANANATLRIELELTAFHGSLGFWLSECGYPILVKMRRHEAVDICAHIRSDSDGVIGLSQQLRLRKDAYRFAREKHPKLWAPPMQSKEASCETCGTKYWLEHLTHRWNFRIRNQGREEDLPNYGFFLVVEKKLGDIEAIKDPLKNVQWLKHAELIDC